MKFTGTIVSIRRETVTSPGPHAVLRVRDYGQFGDLKLYGSTKDCPKGGIRLRGFGLSHNRVFKVNDEINVELTTP